MSKVSEAFGSKVFNDAVMKARLPKDTYKAMQTAIREGKRLDLSVANVVANAMKDWAIEKGATHFTHWFQPLTGITAEKHDRITSYNVCYTKLLRIGRENLFRNDTLSWKTM